MSFDADQTLWDFHGVQRLALEATIAEMERRRLVSPGSVTVEELQTARQQVVDRFRGRPHRLEEVRQASFAHFLRGLGHTHAVRAAAELVEVFLAVRFEAVRSYPEVAGVLGRLSRSYRLGLLSDGNSYPDRCGLPGVFDAVVLGPTYGLEKPDVRLFEILAGELAVPACETLHVGDGRGDVDGANAAGMVSVFLNRDGAAPPFGPAARFEVRDLLELERLLGSIDGGSLRVGSSR